MRFYAYNPLAGGILTGKQKYEDELASGRFNTQTVWGKRYRDRYFSLCFLQLLQKCWLAISRFWHKPLFDAQDEIRVWSQAHDTTNTAVAFSWLLHHSQLQPGDGIVIGGSSLVQVKDNLDCIKNSKPLDEEVIATIDKCWDDIKGVCPQYFR